MTRYLNLKTLVAALVAVLALMAVSELRDAGTVGEADAGAVAPVKGPRWGATAAGKVLTGKTRIGFEYYYTAARATWAFGSGDTKGDAVAEAMTGCALYAGRNDCEIHSDGYLDAEDLARRCVAVAVAEFPLVDIYGFEQIQGVAIDYHYGSTRNAAIGKAIAGCEENLEETLASVCEDDGDVPESCKHTRPGLLSCRVTDSHDGKPGVFCIDDPDVADADAGAVGEADAAAGDYEWPVARVIDGATLVVDASADFPPELAALTVRLRGAGAEDAAALSAVLAGASKVVIRNPGFGGPDCECQVVADVVVDGDSLGEADAGAVAPVKGPRRGATAVGEFPTSGVASLYTWAFGFGDTIGDAVAEAMTGCENLAMHGSCEIHSDGYLDAEDPARRCVAVAVAEFPAPGGIGTAMMAYNYGSTRDAAIKKTIAECEEGLASIATEICDPGIDEAHPSQFLFKLCNSSRAGRLSCRVTDSLHREAGVTCLD